MYQRAKRCALSVRAAFGNITSVYGHIDENGRFVRNWPVRKMAITDKSLENACLSMRFAYGQIIKNEAFVRKFE